VELAERAREPFENHLYWCLEGNNLIEGSLIEKSDFHLPGQLGTVGVNVLCAIQHAIVREFRTYAYLEVGSFKGKSLLPHVLSNNCTKAVSIDLRPAQTPDIRGAIYKYDHVTAEQMIGSIAGYASKKNLQKLSTFTADSSIVATELQNERFEMAFIDGEHTVEGALFDVENLRPVLADDSVLVFDDNSLVYPAIEAAYYLLSDWPCRKMQHFNGGISALILGGRLTIDDFKLRPRFLSSTEKVAKSHGAILSNRVPQSSHRLTNASDGTRSVTK